jgi:hypothetical protein
MVAELEVNSAGLHFELLKLCKQFTYQLLHNYKVTWLAVSMN